MQRHPMPDTPRGEHMTEPTPPRPVPGPPRPGPGPAAPRGSAEEAAAGAGGQPFADLDDLPVAEHVAVYEAEHARLQRQLGTIDQL
jgi:hypothetical protein